MKKLFFITIILFFFTNLQPWAQLPGGHVPNEIMVMLNPSNGVNDLLKTLNSQGLLGQYRLKQTLSKRYNIFLLEHDAILGDSKSLLYDLNKMEQVALAQLNHYIEDRATPNDPSYATNQWAMNNIGQTGGIIDADVDAPEAWEITTGGITADGDTIVVAVVDGGVQRTHPDLQENMWVNHIELAGIAGTDDDGNGYVDDFYGWDASGNDNTLPTSGHATHVAGIIGAKGNNTTGVVGVNWNVKILNVRGSSGTESVVVLAYDYICSLRQLYNNSNGAMGAFVVVSSNSFGVNYGMPANYPIWCAMYDTMGVLGILSAGAGPNLNINVDSFGDIPTTCPSNYMVAVTNTTSTDIKNTGAGFGTINMDIGAPGTSIYSTYSGSGYQNQTGTSMATPYVAGAIGLFYAGACLTFIQDYKANPGTLAQQMKTYLLTGVDSTTDMVLNTYSQGRLNIYKGLLKVQNYNCLGLPPNAQFNVNNQLACIGTSVNFADASTNGPTSWAWTFSGGTPSTASTQNVSVSYSAAGSYDAQLIVTNTDGADTILYANYITINANPAIPTITENTSVLSSSQAGAGNQWYDANGLIIGATNDSYTPTMSGSYFVIYTDVNGCTSTSATYFISVSIETENLFNFTIFPNPITEKLTITTGSIINAHIKIMDLSGRIIMTSKMNESTVEIDVSLLSKGVYVLKIEILDRVLNRKIIVN